MPQLLRIDSSARLQDSHSRKLADQIEAAWLSRHPGARILRRDLVQQPLPHIADATIAGYYTPDDQHTPESRAATALSDTLITELTGADALLISAPMYNFSIPSSLKAWIDQIVRVNRTFGFDPQKGLFGLLDPKPVYVACAFGAAGYRDGAYAAMNFHEPYLRSLFGFLGLSEVTFFTLEGSAVDPAALEATGREARAAMAQLFAGAGKMMEPALG